jgi:methyltransferase (TIGR00027 family)
MESLRLSVAAALAAYVARAIAHGLFRKRELPFAVSDSSRSIAALRAIETERADAAPLFLDPFASALAGEAALARVRARGLEGDNGRIAIRTRFFDDAVKDALAATDNTPWQVVLLGAGLDTRAWRLAPPSAATKASAVFEVDVPEVLDGKEAVLRGAPLTLSRSYRAVRSNLASPPEKKGGWLRELRAAGHDPEAPTMWVLEGLLYYLAPGVVDEVLRGARAVSAPASRLVASVVNRASLLRATKPGSRGAKATWASASDDPERDFSAAGWRMMTVAQPGDATANYGRWRADPPPPRESTDSTNDATPRTFYVVCEVKRRDER